MTSVLSEFLAQSKATRWCCLLRLFYSQIWYSVELLRQHSLALVTSQHTQNMRVLTSPAISTNLSTAIWS